MFSKKICASNSSLKVTRMRRAVIQDYKNLDKSLFLLPGLSFSPWLSIYRWIVSTGAIFKDFFCSLWHLIVQHLSAIFHNQNQTKTLNENYYLNSLCTLTHCLFRPSKFQEHIVLFSIIIYLLYQNKCFCDFLWIWADMLECAIHPLTYRWGNSCYGC